jgi:hypothetical protein
MGELDISLRAVASTMPEDLAAVSFPDARIEVRGWRESQLTTMERRMDDLLELVVDDAPVFAHYEWMERWEPDTPERLYEYQALAVCAQLQQIAARRAERVAQRAPGDRARIPREHVVPIESTVVVLSGPRKRTLPDEGSFRTSLRRKRFSGVRFRIVAVHQQGVDDLLAMPGRLWTVFAPAARDASTAGVARAVRRVEQRARSASEMADLLATMSLVAESQGALGAIQEMLMKAMDEKGITFTSTLYRRGHDDGAREGLKEGLKEGLGAVVHMFERKLGRALTAQEREVIYLRAETQGTVRLGDIALDLDGPALAAWLATSTV